MAQNRVFGSAPGMKPMSMAPVFGEPVYEVIIETNARGLMKTTITKYPEGAPPTQLQLMGMFLDAMMGQFQMLQQSASMLVDPNGKGLHGKTEKSNNTDGGTSGGTDHPNGS